MRNVADNVQLLQLLSLTIACLSLSGTVPEYGGSDGHILIDVFEPRLRVLQPRCRCQYFFQALKDPSINTPGRPAVRPSVVCTVCNVREEFYLCAVPSGRTFVAGTATADDRCDMVDMNV